MVGRAFRIDTQRMRLRAWKEEDALLLDRAIHESLAHLQAKMNWARTEPIAPAVRTELMRDLRRRFEAGEDCNYGLFSPDESRVLGGAGLHARVGPEACEIGYWIHVNETRSGYATEAAAALTRVAFELDGVRRVEIRCDPENRFSARVAEKLGFRHEATLAKRLPPLDSGWRDVMVWSLFLEEYASRPASKFPIVAFDGAGVQLL